MSKQLEPGTVQVRFVGTDRVTVTLEGPEEAAPAVLMRAAQALGVTVELGTLALVQNGTQVPVTDATVHPDDRLTASGKVSNG